jgi:uncharacterized protein YndB with AHSA1/START domain
MPELELTRRYDAPPEKVFRAVTDSAMLAQWWGPEGVRCETGDLDFTQIGPWGSVMINAEGGRHKVTGQVTHVDPPRSVGFTWAWHDDDDVRGPESHVTFSVAANEQGGSTFSLRHMDLSDAESAENHNRGWGSSLGKLDAILAP